MNRTLAVAACLAALGLAPIALAAPKDDAAPAARPARGSQQGPMRHRFQRARRMLASLDLTDAQKASLKDARQAAGPVREDLRAQLKALRASMKGVEKTPETRQAARAKRRALIDAAAKAVEPSAQRFVASLSTEQRAKLEARAKEHGKTFDEARFTKRIERLLLASRPGRRGCRGDAGK